MIDTMHKAEGIGCGQQVGRAVQVCVSIAETEAEFTYELDGASAARIFMPMT